MKVSLSTPVYILMSSIGFLVPGLVRTKTSAVSFGIDGIALFGQLSQFQTVLIATSAVGVVTATRVFLARENLQPKVRAQKLAWLLWMPVLTASILSLVLCLASSQLADLLLGNQNYSFALCMGAVGVIPAIAAQIGIAASQAARDRHSQSVAALSSAILGGLSAWLLVASGNQNIAALSFLISPLLQFLIVLIVLPNMRLNIFTRPSLEKGDFHRIFQISGASAVLGIAATLTELISRTLILQSHGVIGLASYQPVTLISAQFVGMILSAISTSALLHFASNPTFESAGTNIELYLKQMLPIILSLLALLIGFSPLLIAFFYNQEIVQDSLFLVILSLSGESVRTLAWILGSTLLPLSLARYWLISGLFAVATQLTSVILLQYWIGPLALIIGVILSSTTNVLMTTGFLFHKQIYFSLRLLFVIPLFGFLIFGSFFIFPIPISYLGLIPAPLLTAVIFAAWALRARNLQFRELYENSKN